MGLITGNDEKLENFPITGCPLFIVSFLDSPSFTSQINTALESLSWDQMGSPSEDLKLRWAL